VTLPSIGDRGGATPWGKRGRRRREEEKHRVRIWYRKQPGHCSREESGVGLVEPYKIPGTELSEGLKGLGSYCFHSATKKRI